MRALWIASLFLFVGCGGAPTPPAITGTPPPPGVVRYIVGGDSRDDSAHVLPWAFREAKARQASAFFFLGDMELTPSLDDHFVRALSLLDPIPFYPALGNHEVRFFGFVGGIGKAQAEGAFRRRFLGTARTPVTSSLEGKVVYSVDLDGGVHFVALDNVSQNGFGANQLAWLAADLEAARAKPTTKYIVVGMHKPLAKNGILTHGMDADGAQAITESDAALALFVKYRASLLIASHAHRFVAFTQGGIRSYITGGLGAPLDRTPEPSYHHFLQLDVSDAEIKVQVVRFDGKPSIATEEERE